MMNVIHECHVLELQIRMNVNDSHIDQLPVGLIAQLVEHCISIAEVRVRIPIHV